MTEPGGRPRGGEPAQVRYHAAALGLLDVRPTLDPVAMLHLERFESERGITLPAAVREWYGLLEGPHRPEYVHASSVWDADEFGQYNWHPQYEGDGPHCDPTHERGLLLLLLHSQYWAVSLNEAEDPEVVTAWDAFSPTATWEPGAATFSDFVYTRIWDYPTRWQPRAAFFETEPCGPAVLTALETHWQTRPATQSGTSRRFAAPDDSQRIRLTNSATGTRHGAPVTQWSLWAATDMQLAELSTQVRDVLAASTGRTPPAT